MQFLVEYCNREAMMEERVFSGKYCKEEDLIRVALL